MIDYAQLKIDDAAGHPVTGAFSAVVATAVAEWHALNVTNSALSAQLALKFLLLDNTYNLNTGNDTQDRAIWQRMKDVAAITIPEDGVSANPWGAATFTITEIRLIKTHQLVDLFTLSAQGDLPIDLTDSNFRSYLAGAQAAGCMSTAQETALLALNKISYAVEKGYASLRYADIVTARALP